MNFKRLFSLSGPFIWVQKKGTGGCNEQMADDVLRHMILLRPSIVLAFVLSDTISIAFAQAIIIHASAAVICTRSRSSLRPSHHFLAIDHGPSMKLKSNEGVKFTKGKAYSTLKFHLTQWRSEVWRRPGTVGGEVGILRRKGLNFLIVYHFWRPHPRRPRVFAPAPRYATDLTFLMDLVNDASHDARCNDAVIDIISSYLPWIIYDITVS